MSYDTETIAEPKCPKCSGKLWDNRETKTNPKAPDFKCRDKGCDGVIWPPKNVAPRAQPAVKPVATSGKVPYSSGPALPYETESETGAPPTGGPSWDKLFNAYDVCFDHALTVAKKMDKAEVGSSPESVAAIAATLLIQADRQGLTR